MKMKRNKQIKMGDLVLEADDFAANVWGANPDVELCCKELKFLTEAVCGWL